MSTTATATQTTPPSFPTHARSKSSTSTHQKARLSRAFWNASPPPPLPTPSPEPNKFARRQSKVPFADIIDTNRPVVPLPGLENADENNVAEAPPAAGLGIRRRVSSLFKRSPGKPGATGLKKSVSASASVTTSSGGGVGYTLPRRSKSKARKNVSLGSFTEDEEEVEEDDDIRRPSGLGDPTPYGLFPDPPSHPPSSFSFHSMASRSTPSLVKKQGSNTSLRPRKESTDSQRPIDDEGGLASKVKRKLSLKRNRSVSRASSQTESNTSLLPARSVTDSPALTPTPSAAPPPQSVHIPKSSIPIPPIPPPKSLSLPLQFMPRILSHLPLSMLPTCALVSRPWLDAARNKLYGHITFPLPPKEATTKTSSLSAEPDEFHDAHSSFQEIIITPEDRQETYLTHLASHPHLTAITHTFECTEWPESYLAFLDLPSDAKKPASLVSGVSLDGNRSRVDLAVPPSPGPPSPPSPSPLSPRHFPMSNTSNLSLPISPTSPQQAFPPRPARNTEMETPPLIILLRNLSSLSTLILPSFSLPLLRHHTAFGLTSLTFHSQSTMSMDEWEKLRRWLDGQVNVRQLSFPRLSSFDFERKDGAEMAGTSTTFLPNVERVQGPPELVTLLCSSSLRPQLQFVELNVGKCLVQGLRIGEVVVAISSLSPKVRLHIAFDADKLDRRTVEKVISTCAAKLGSSLSELVVSCIHGQASSQGGFEVPVAVVTSLEKHVPRFGVLEAIHVHVPHSQERIAGLAEKWCEKVDGLRVCLGSDCQDI